MRVLIDGAALQSRVHFQDGVRLASFIACLASAGGQVAFQRGPLTDLQADVLVIPTRSPADIGSSPGTRYSTEELDDIASFVRMGGGLLLMTNHGDVPDRAPDHTAEDARLAERFGITIERTCFVDPAGPAEMAASAGHPVTDGVARVVTMTTSSLIGTDATVLVPLPPSMIERCDRAPASGRSFALAAERGGRVVVVGNSGFIGTPGTALPNRGLLAVADNSRFVVNAIRWLADHHA